MERDPAHDSAAGMGTRSDRLNDPDPGDLPPVDAVKSAFSALVELREYVGYYLSARADGFKLTIRRAAVLAALGIIAALAGGAVVVTAAVQICIGLAQGLGRLMNGHVWAGHLIVGVVLLSLIFAVGYLMVSRLFKSWRVKTVQKYEIRKQQQRADFGHDVRQRARQQQ